MNAAGDDQAHAERADREYQDDHRDERTGHVIHELVRQHRGRRAGDLSRYVHGSRRRDASPCGWSTRCRTASRISATFRQRQALPQHHRPIVGDESGRHQRDGGREHVRQRDADLRRCRRPCPTDEIWLDLGNVTDSDLAPGTTETYTLELQLQALNVAANTGAATRTNRGRIRLSADRRRRRSVRQWRHRHGDGRRRRIVKLTKTVASALGRRRRSGHVHADDRNNSSGPGAGRRRTTGRFADTLPADLSFPGAGDCRCRGRDRIVRRQRPDRHGNQARCRYAGAGPIHARRSFRRRRSARRSSIRPTRRRRRCPAPTAPPTRHRARREAATVNAPAAAATSCAAASSNSNNLNAATTAPFTTNSINVTKTMLAPQSYYAIGDVAQYQVQITMPVGTATTVRMVDTLPAGLAFNSAARRSPTPQVSPIPERRRRRRCAGRRSTFTLGNVTATAAGTITIQYSGRSATSSATRTARCSSTTRRCCSTIRARRER